MTDINEPRLYSIIVPVYNAEKTLHRCVDSILAQTYTNFELLLIDDGSKDRSKAIIDEYAALDTRVVAIHKTNGGVSSARNAGLNKAIGDYIVFIDSDDYINNTYLSEFIPYNEDIIIGGHQTFGYRCEIDIPHSFLVETDEQKPNMIESQIGSLNIRTLWAKTINRNLIEKNKIRFKLEMRLGEDTEFMFRCISNCKNIRFISTSSYNYFVRKDRMKDYKITAYEYNVCIRALRSSIEGIAPLSIMSKTYEMMLIIFDYTFKIGLWHCGINYAKWESRQWIRLRMWQFIPNKSLLFRLRKTVVMILWPYVYRKLIINNAELY